MPDIYSICFLVYLAPNGISSISILRDRGLIHLMIEILTCRTSSFLI